VPLNADNRVAQQRYRARAAYTSIHVESADESPREDAYRQRMADEPIRALEALASASEQLVDVLSGLVRIPSVGGSPAECEVVHRVAGLLDAEAIEIDLWQLPLAEITAQPDFPGMEVDRTEAWGLVARLPGRDGGPSLMLNGHLDVVPPGDLAAWAGGRSGDPYDGRVADGGIDGRAVFGRGTCDMKGGAVAALYAVLALHRAGVRPAGDLLAAFVVGEEDGGLGTYGLLRRGWRADACVITEPTSLDVMAANGGALTFRLRVPGRAAHASMRTAGVSAVEKFQRIFGVLRELEATRNARVDPLMARWDIAYPVEVGGVRAGDWSSTVPDLLIAEGRFGVALDEPVDAARAALESAIAQACAADDWLAEHPVTVEWWGGQFASGRCPPESDLVSRVRAAHGAPIDVFGAPYGSDLRLLTGIGGIPTVQYGPGDVRYAHSPDERVPIDQVLDCAATLIRLAVA
jgi:acetylornithine deacetylase